MNTQSQETLRSFGDFTLEVDDSLMRAIVDAGNISNDPNVDEILKAIDYLKGESCTTYSLS